MPVPAPISSSRPTPFFGRRTELERIQSLLSSGERLITVVGMGGMGKTRLALEVLAQGRDAGKQISFCNLTSVEDEDSLAIALLASLPPHPNSAQAPAAPAAPVTPATEEGLKKHIESLGSELDLWILDNGEELLNSLRPLLKSLLQANPALRVLLTSRLPLDIGEEALLRLGPLQQNEALELFASLVARQGVGLGLEAAGHKGVQALIETLDGIPLAVELAAGRMGVLSPGDLLARLKKEMRVLSGKEPDRPSRHQKLNAVVASSFDALSADEQETLLQLSVFNDPFDVNAAESVVESDEILFALEKLLERSLLHFVNQSARSGRNRFRLLEVIRLFARQKRAAWPKEKDQSLIRRYGRTILEQAEALQSDFHGPDRRAAMEAMRSMGNDMNNVFNWALEHDKDMACRMMLAADEYLLDWGPTRYHQSLLRRALACARGLASRSAEARILASQSRTIFRDGDLHLALEAARDAEKAIARWRRQEPENLDAKRLEISNLSNQAMTEQYAGGWRAAEKPSRKAIKAARALGESAPLAQALGAHAVIACDCGEYGSARRAVGEVLTYTARVEDSGQATRLWNLAGVVYMRCGQFEKAIQCFEQVFEFHERFGNPGQMLNAHANLGLVAMAQGRFNLARTHLEKARDLAQKVVREVTEIRLEADLGCLDLCVGRVQEGVDRLGPLVELLLKNGQKRVAGWTLVHWASGLALLGENGDDLSQARQAFKRAYALLPEGDETSRVRFGLYESLLDQKPAHLEATLAQAEKMTRGDAAILTAIAGHLLRRALLRTEPEESLRIKEGGAAFCIPGGDWISLEKRPTLGPILEGLVEAHAQQPGRPLSVKELFAIGWPGEKALEAAMKNRVQVAVSTLRKIGLKGYLITRNKGYLFAPELPVLLGPGP
jgi:predicted ATPase